MYLNLINQYVCTTVLYRFVVTYANSSSTDYSCKYKIPRCSIHRENSTYLQLSKIPHRRSSPRINVHVPAISRGSSFQRQQRRLCTSARRPAAWTNASRRRYLADRISTVVCRSKEGPAGPLDPVGKGTRSTEQREDDRAKNGPRFPIGQIVNNASPLVAREISRSARHYHVNIASTVVPEGERESTPFNRVDTPSIHYSMGANVIWRRSGGFVRERLSCDEIRRSPLVIQLARHCPMILDRPPIHRFNAVERHVWQTPPLCPPSSTLSIVVTIVVAGPPWWLVSSQIPRRRYTDDKWHAGRSISLSSS